MHKVKNFILRILRLLLLGIYYFANIVILAWTIINLIADWQSLITSQRYYELIVPTTDRFLPPPQFSLVDYTQLIYIVCLIIVSLLALVLPHYIKKFAGIRGRALFLFAVEMPILAFGFCIFTLGTLMPYTNLIMQLFICVLISPNITLLLSFYPKDSSKLRTGIYFVLQTAVTVLNFYACLLYLFIVTDLLTLVFSNYINEPLIRLFSTSQNLRYSVTPTHTYMNVLTVLASLVLASISISALIFLPIALLRWILKRSVFFYQRVTEKFSQRTARIACVATILGTVILGVAVTRPPQFRYLPLFSEYAQLSNSTESTAFEKQKEIARKLIQNKTAATVELHNLQNIERRYPLQKDFSITQLRKDNRYESAAAKSAWDTFIDQTFLLLAYPFVLPIERIDYTSTYSTVAREVLSYDIYSERDVSPLLSRSAQLSQVDLTERTIEITTQQENRLALVTVTDTYSNTGTGEQETIAEFMLPTGSVVVDLKLGQNLEFPGVVAPRGAARATYEAEQQQRRDPALLQQVGPDQYRLRVFPIPRIAMGKQKVQYSYITPVSPEGYGIPQYVLENNYRSPYGESRHPTVVVNGQIYSDEAAQSFIPSASTFCDLQDSSLGTTNQSFLISDTTSRTYHCSLATQKLALTQPVGKRIALLLDVSTSNAQTNMAQKLEEFFSTNPQLLVSNTVTLYEVNTKLSQGVQLTPENFKSELDSVVWFGTSDFTKILELVPTDLDALFIITANNSTASTSRDIEKVKNLPDLYLVYPNLTTAPGWNPELSDALFNKTVSANRSIDEAWLRFITTQNKTSAETQVNPYWRVVAVNAQTLLGELINQSFTPTTIQSDFPELFRQYQKLRAQMEIAASGVNLQAPSENNLRVLDALTKQAQQLHVVTPLTSMIALVTERQEERLAENSQNANRYSDWTNLANLRPSTPINKVLPGAGWSNQPILFNSANIPTQRMYQQSKPTSVDSQLGLLSGPTERDFENTNYLQIKQESNSSVMSIVLILVLMASTLGLLIFYRKYKRHSK